MKVFISHTARDEKIAKALAKALKEKGFLVFFGEDFSPGSKISAEINSELKNSDAIVAILSEYSFSSEWVRKEIDEALFNEKFKDRFFPVLLSNSSEDLSRLPWVLKKISHFRISPDGTTEAIGKKIAVEFGKFISRGK